MSHFELSGQRWNPGDLIITWSIATQNFGGQPGGPFDDFIDNPAIVADIATAVSWWDEQSGVTFQMVADAADVDVRFGFSDLPGQGGGLTTYFFDSNEFFEPGITIELDYADNDPPSLPLIAHEVGHALGLDHFEGEDAIMNSIVDVSWTGLFSSDIHGIQFLYGADAPPAEPPENPELLLGDVLWQHTDGTVATLNHDLGVVPHNWSIQGVGNFDGDGDSDIIWRHVDGLVVTWELENGEFVTNHNIAFASIGWEIVDAGGDFDADGDSDVLWRHRDGAVVTWEMENGAYVQNHNIEFASVGWTMQGVGDFDADGDSDIIWRHRDGAVVTWEMEDNDYLVNHNIAFASVGWTIEGTGDIDGDRDDDILWRHNEGAVVAWEMEGGAYITNRNIGEASPSFQIQGFEDFDSDGDDDILFRDGAGTVVTWELQGGAFVQADNLGAVPTAWQIRGTGEFDLV
jgi:Matrixin